MASGARTIVAYDWDMNGDGTIDTNTGTNAIAQVMTARRSQTVDRHATDSNFNKRRRDDDLSRAAAASAEE